MENEQPKWRAIAAGARAVAGEPWCFLSLLYFTYMGLAAVDQYLLEGRPVTGALAFMWERALAFAQLPLVQLLAIPFAMWMFAHGVRRIMRRQEEAEKQVAATRTQAADEIRAEIRRELEMPIAMTQLKMLEDEATELGKAVGELKASIDRYEMQIGQERNAIASARANARPGVAATYEQHIRKLSGLLTPVDQAILHARLAAGESIDDWNMAPVPEPGVVTSVDQADAVVEKHQARCNLSRIEYDRLSPILATKNAQVQEGRSKIKQGLYRYAHG